jgi:hypothetical protein
MTTNLSNGRGWLSDAAAASIHRIDRQIGRPLDINEAGRTWEQQNQHWLTYKRYGKPIALHPDTPSIHQLGNAIDTDDRLIAIMNDHGWRQTVFRNGQLVEPWHFEYFINEDNHRNEGVADVNAGQRTAGPNGVKRRSMRERQRQRHVVSGDLWSLVLVGRLQRGLHRRWPEGPQPGNSASDEHRPRPAPGQGRGRRQASLRAEHVERNRG